MPLYADYEIKEHKIIPIKVSLTPTGVLVSSLPKSPELDNLIEEAVKGKVRVMKDEKNLAYIGDALVVTEEPNYIDLPDAYDLLKQREDQAHDSLGFKIVPYGKEEDIYVVIDTARTGAVGYVRTDRLDSVGCACINASYGTLDDGDIYAFTEEEAQKVLAKLDDPDCFALPITHSQAEKTILETGYTVQDFINHYKETHK